MDEQVLIQDTLKHIAERAYDQLPASRESIAVELATSQSEVARILGDLEAARLIEPGSLILTAEGREYALHVLRAHRLYETYLARKTGVSESQWHVQAHIEEHKLSVEDVEKLDRELNYPLFDPHGDPIPTASGKMPPKRGQPLGDYPEGWEGRVVHVEDKPPHLYALIARASIAPGTVLRVARKNAQNFSIMLEGCEYSFANEVAEKITVVPLEKGEHFDETLLRLSSLTDNEKASVVRLSPLCFGLERNRLLDLGLVPGTTVTLDLISPSGSPTAYRVRGASIALRREQAERVLIRKSKESTHG